MRGKQDQTQGSEAGPVAPLNPHSFQLSSPAFLRMLDDDPRSALARFADEAYRNLANRGPKVLVSAPADVRDDWIQEIVIHFISENCRVLRRYIDEGRPFWSYFITVSTRKALDLYRLWKKREDQKTDIEAADQMARPKGLDGAEWAQFKRTLKSCLAQLSARCQILLRLRFKEYRARELTRVVRLLLGEDLTNVQIANAQEHCLQRLEDCLGRSGYDKSFYA